MHSMDLGEREQAPSKQATSASKEPAIPERVAVPAGTPKPDHAKTDRTWAARRQGCPQWADNVEPF